MRERVRGGGDERMRSSFNLRYSFECQVVDDIGEEPIRDFIKLIIIVQVCIIREVEYRNLRPNINR